MIKEFLSKSEYFTAFLSIMCLMLGLFARKKLKLAIANPLLIAIVFIMLSLWLTGVDYETYSADTRFFGYLLTPATVCLAIPLYSQFDRLRSCWKAVAAGIATGVFVNLLCILACAILFHFTHEQYVTILPKSVTTAIGVPLSVEIGGIKSVSAAAIILTGITGNIAAEHILNAVRVRDPAARGLAFGVGSHAIGTARALELGELEGAMSSLAIVLTGFLTVALSPLFSLLA